MVRHRANRWRGLAWGLGAATALLAVGLLAPRAARAFDLDDVARRAQAMAAEPFRDPKGEVPDWLLFPKLQYDQWRDIRFRPDRALWHDRASRFRLQFFHAGLYFDRTIKLNVIEGDRVSPAPFSTKQFDYGKNTFADKIPKDLGYAGFRVHYPLRTAQYYDEVIVFLGASYFRALGREQVYGLSARGLALNTATGSPEEFPYFREYWLVAPAPDADELTIYALLDGPSVTGAYRFVVRPGDQTVVDVDCRLFVRRAVERFGVAPLTSMFFFGENTARPFEDFRPEVHDSDGMLLHFASGEWLWRGLDNPSTIQTGSFQMPNPRGFGLIQRDRDFDHHQDLETRADLRPSVWVEPRGDWGEGSAVLVELPTRSEIEDNIVSMWVPQRTLQPGETLSLAYRMYWYGDDPARPPGGRVVATRRDHGTRPQGHRFVVDFAGGALEKLAGDAPVEGVVTVVGGAQAGELFDQHVVKNPVTGGWRLTLQVVPARPQPLELRAFLKTGDDVLTETWSYVLLP